MTISTFDPFSTLDRMLSRYSGGGAFGGSQSLSVPMDVYRKGDDFIVELDLPGADPASIDMTVERSMLTVGGEVHAKHKDVDEVVVCERPHARFRRQVYLGENLDTDKIEANFNNGVLTVRIPIAEKQRARKIEVSGGEQPQQAIDVGGDSGRGQ